MNNKQRTIKNENEEWTMINDQWTMNDERWTKYDEQWTMKNKQWTMNNEQLWMLCSGSPMNGMSEKSRLLDKSRLGLCMVIYYLFISQGWASF